jgi:hypothetical protein
MGVSGGETCGIHNPREPWGGGAGRSTGERVYGNNLMRLLRGVPEVQTGDGSVTAILLGAFHTGDIVPAETGGRGGEAVWEQAEWKERMREHKGLIVRRATGTVPEQKEMSLIAKRMGKWEDEYFRFIEAGTDVANNPAELAIRQGVSYRSVTQGSRGTAGNEWHERF